MGPKGSCKQCMIHIFYIVKKFQQEVFGDHLKQQVEDRLKFLDTGEVPQKNIDVMKEAVQEASIRQGWSKKKGFHHLNSIWLLIEIQAADMDEHLILMYIWLWWIFVLSIDSTMKSMKIGAISEYMYKWWKRCYFK